MAPPSAVPLSALSSEQRALVRALLAAAQAAGHDQARRDRLPRGPSGEAPRQGASPRTLHERFGLSRLA